MNLNKHLLLWGGIASLLLSGCQDEDFGFTELEIKTKTSFEKHFGEIKPDQVWDFSSYNMNRLGLQSGFNQTATTRAAYNGVDDTPMMPTTYAEMIGDEETRWYEVPSELTNWLDKNLREEVFNKKRGTTHFTLTMPEDRDIVIIPIYQGQAGLISNLCIKSEETANGEPLFPEGYIWKKSDGIQVLDNGTWSNLGGQGYYDHTVGKKTRAHAIQLKHGQIKGKFSLYLDMQNLSSPWDGQGGGSFATTFMTEKHASSTNGQMVALSLAGDAETFSAVSQALSNGFSQPTVGEYGDTPYTYSNFMLIGCEDSNKDRDLTSNGDGWRLIGTDWDMNDMVFLVAGLSLNDVETNQVIKKRYMIEDLGSDFDYDFNDIVIDVTQIKTTQRGQTVVKQYAQLAHLCGTIPWRVQIGNWTSDILPGRNGGCEKYGPGYDPSTDPDTYGALVSELGKEITGWDPDNNNIIVTAWPNAAGEDIPAGASDWTDAQKTNYLKEVDGTSYTFPKPGKYPFIIAVDQSVMWKTEMDPVEATNIITWKRAEYNTSVSPINPDDPGYVPGDGDDPTVAGINSVTPPVVPGAGPVELNVELDSWADDILIHPELLRGIGVGYTIKAVIKPKDGAKMMYLSMKSPWTAINENMTMGTGETEFQVTVTSKNLAELRQYGIALKGINVVVESIEIIPGTYVDPDRTDIDWDTEYNEHIGNFNPSFYITPDKCENLHVGDVITINAIIDNVPGLMYPSNPSYIQVTDYDFHLMPGTIQTPYYYQNQHVTHQVVITQEMLNKMQANGFIVQGKNVTFINVTNNAATWYTFTAGVAVESAGRGTVTVDPQQDSYLAGSTVTIKAEANEGYVFDSWSDGDTSAERYVILDEDNMKLYANFREAAKYQVKISVGANGTLKINGVLAELGSYQTQAAEGSTIQVEAVANDGYNFASWSDGNTEASRTITVTAPVDITGSFAVKTYTVTVNANDASRGTVTGGGTYEHGATAHLTATANEGYRFAGWSDGDTDAERDVTITDDVTYTAKFVAEGAVTIWSGEVSFQDYTGNKTINFTLPAGVTFTEFTKLKVYTDFGREVTISSVGPEWNTEYWHNITVASGESVMTFDLTPAQAEQFDSNHSLVLKWSDNKNNGSMLKITEIAVEN